MGKKSSTPEDKDSLSKHRGFISDYASVKENYDKLAKTLDEILRAVAKDIDPLAVVMARAKGISSFAEKVIKKNKYTDPLKEVTDLAGGRIIVHMPQQVEKVCAFIRGNFEIDEKNSFDFRNHLKIGEFGYRSVHYIVTPVKSQIKGIKISKVLQKLKAEIQVRTFLEHNWADIGHDRLYKTNIKVPVHWNREAARLAAIMENADREFTAMANTLDTFSTGFRINYTPDTIEEEIKKLKALIALEENQGTRLKNILRLCNVFAVQDDWQKITGIIDENLKKEEDSILALKVRGEYYRAKLMQFPGKKNTPSFDKAIQELEKIGESLLEASEKDDVEDNFSILFSASKIYLYLGSTLSKVSNKVNEARKHFNTAHKLIPEDPYYFCRAVVFEIRNCKDAEAAKHLLKLVTPQLEHAAAQCITNLEIGANGALTYSTLGRIYYLLGREVPALSAYTKAMDLVVHKETLISDQYFREEMNIHKDLEKIIDKDLSVQIQLIIALTLWIKNKNKKDSKLLTKTFKMTAPQKEAFKEFGDKVLIIAGGAAFLDAKKVESYREYVSEALSDFKGTVISGGTTSGIPGLVGNVVNMLKKTISVKFNLIGYLPEDPLPFDAQKDNDYDFFGRTKGNGFSALELLNYWNDILQSGIDPSNVFVLGINGGKISDLEYKLALAFGAKVGLITSSGRAVADLMLDKVWSDHPNLLPIPDDKYTVWALLNHLKPTQIEPEKIKSMAKAIHKNYRAKAFDDIKKFKFESTDVNYFKPLMEWKFLDPKLKSSNKHQARFIEHEVKKVNLAVSPSSDPVLYKINKSKKLRNKLAILEHARWNAERLMSGWRYAPQKDINKNLTPYLVSWEDLPDYIKDFDFEAVNAFPEILKEAGYEIRDEK